MYVASIDLKYIENIFKLKILSSTTILQWYGICASNTYGCSTNNFVESKPLMLNVIDYYLGCIKINEAYG